MVKRRKHNKAVIKHEVEQTSSPTESNDLVSARDKFQEALREICPDSEDETDRESEDESQTSQKKELQNANTSEIKQPFVMKLFDRNLDLAYYTDNTPLYVICRAWIANHPRQSCYIPVPAPKKTMIPEIKEEPPSPPRDEELVQDIYWLPPPTDVNTRIPLPCERTTNYTTLFQDVEPPTKEELLIDNRKHWIRVRQSWSEASKKNEERFKKSLTTLTAIFNKAQNQQL